MTHSRALSMPGVNMNAAIKKAVQDAVDAGETEKAQRIVLDVLGSAFAADAAQQVIRNNDVVELLPCPFCGGPAIMGTLFTKGREYYVVHCDDCLARGPVDETSISEDVARELWNQRAPVSVTVGDTRYTLTQDGITAERPAPDDDSYSEDDES